tara:strand:+ start:1065 stop:2696 length:1632 start_codon:yes stop_codon:yes gene_type:complete
MRRIYIFLICLCTAFVSFTQDLQTTEIKVLEGYSPSIPQALRLNTKATYQDTSKIDKSQIYSLVNKVFYRDYKTRELSPAKIRHASLIKPLGSRLILGIGISSQNKANFSFNKSHSKSIVYGVSFDHIDSQFKDNLNSRYRNTEQSIYSFVKVLAKKNITSFSLSYDKLNASYNDQNNGFRSSELLINTFSRNFSKQKTRHNSSFLVSDFNEMSENKINLSSIVFKEIDDKLYEINFSFTNYLNYSREEVSFGRLQSNIKAVNFNPSTTFKKLGFDIQFGLNFDWQDDSLAMSFTDNSQKISIFPKINIANELVDDIVFLNFGIRNHVFRHTLESLSLNNSFIHSFGMNQSDVNDNSLFSQNLKQTNKKEVFIFLKNYLSNDQYVDIHVSAAEITNFQFFQDTIIADYNRFFAEYSDLKHFHASIVYFNDISDVIDLKVFGDYYYYDQIISYQPSFRCGLELPISLRNKIKAIPSLDYIDDKTAGELYEINSKLFFDFKLRYNYSQKISLNIDFKNISGSKYELWKGYYDLGFNVLFGLKYSF